MRVSLLCCLGLLLAPVATSGHPAPQELASDVGEGASIVLALDASGSISSHGSGTQRQGASFATVTHDYSFSYSWGGTVQLDLRADGLLSGDAQLTGAGSGRLLDHSHREIYDFEGNVVNEIDAERACDPRIQLFNGGQLHARGLVDQASGELVVVIQSVADPTTPPSCTFTSEGGSEESALFPPPPLSPLLVEGIRAIKANDARVKRIEPNLDEINAANALIFSIPLQNGHAIVRGHGSGELPVEYGSEPMGYACPPPMEAQIVKGTCRASGTLHARVLVDPCPALRESRAIHLAAVKALARPANGSSESQVRAFAVDVRAKIGALLADERALQLICGDEGADGLVAVADATQKVVDAWLDVAKTHGLSDEGKRDLLGAERSRQLAGSGDGSAEAAAILGEVVSNPGAYGRVVVRVHSPVALHAWDEAGRHVGWNESTDAPDAQIDGANYTGSPGAAQELALPSGFYKIAVVELGEGAYLLDSAWNGTAGEGAELLPAASEGGRTLVMNVLLDERGYLAGGAQRIATRTSAPFAFVEEWRPMDAAPSAAAGRAADGTSGADEDAGAAGGSDAPGAGVWTILAAVAAVALLARRGR